LARFCGRDYPTWKKFPQRQIIASPRSSPRPNGSER